MKKTDVALQRLDSWRPGSRLASFLLVVSAEVLIQYANQL